jgi:hypothetical protein
LVGDLAIVDRLCARSRQQIVQSPINNQKSTTIQRSTNQEISNAR